MSEQRPFPVLPVALVSVSLVLLVMVPMIAIMSWGMNRQSNSSDNSSTPTVVTAREFTINIADFAFDPVNVSVPSGATVTWANADTAPHNATARDGSWKTGTLDKGESDAITFDTPGTWRYNCTIHPYMEGTITAR